MPNRKHLNGQLTMLANPKIIELNLDLSWLIFVWLWGGGNENLALLFEYSDRCVITTSEEIIKNIKKDGLFAVYEELKNQEANNKEEQEFIDCVDGFKQLLCNLLVVPAHESKKGWRTYGSYENQSKADVFKELAQLESYLDMAGKKFAIDTGVAVTANNVFVKFLPFVTEMVQSNLIERLQNLKGMHVTYGKASVLAEQALESLKADSASAPADVTEDFLSELKTQTTPRAEGITQEEQNLILLMAQMKPIKVFSAAEKQGELLQGLAQQFLRQFVKGEKLENFFIDKYSLVTPGNMYSLPSNLEKVDLTIFSNVTEVGNNLLEGCGSLVSLDLNPLSNVTTVGRLFLYGCSSLVSLDLGPLSNVNTVGRGFLYACRSLVSLDLGPLSKVTTVGSYFLKDCHSLVSLDLSPLSNVTAVGWGFLNGCSSLQQITLPDNVSPALLNACKKFALNHTNCKIVITSDGEHLASSRKPRP